MNAAPCRRSCRTTRVTKRASFILWLASFFNASGIRWPLISSSASTTWPVPCLYWLTPCYTPTLCILSLRQITLFAQARDVFDLLMYQDIRQVRGLYLGIILIWSCITNSLQHQSIPLNYRIRRVIVNVIDTLNPSQ